MQPNYLLGGPAMVCATQTALGVSANKETAQERHSMVFEYLWRSLA